MEIEAVEKDEIHGNPSGEAFRKWLRAAFQHFLLKQNFSKTMVSSLLKQVARKLFGKTKFFAFKKRLSTLPTGNVFFFASFSIFPYHSLDEEYFGLMTRTFSWA